MVPMWWQHLAWFLLGWAVGVPVSKWAEAKLRKHCIGYPDCDGDLPGEEHSEKCPLYEGEKP